MQTCTVMRRDAHGRHRGARQTLEKEGKLQEIMRHQQHGFRNPPLPLPSQEPGPALDFFLLKGVFVATVACLGVKLWAPVKHLQTPMKGTEAD